MNVEHYRQMQESVVHVELPARTAIEVMGGDRAKFLHNLSTNDINKLAASGPGHGCEAYFTTVQGKILLHASLFCHSDSMVMDASPGFADAILPHLDKYLITEDVTLTDRSNEWRQIWIAGPKAADALQSVGFTVPKEVLSHHTVDAVTLHRVPFASVDSFLLRLPSSQSQAWQSKLQTTGSVLVDNQLAELARIEAGYPAYGQDITDENLPQEIGRDDQSISFTKGCYLGQETVARIDALGHVNRYLVPLGFPDSADADVGAEIQQEIDGELKVVGRVTSIARAAAGPIGLGFVRRTAIESNAKLICRGSSLVIREG